MEQELTLEAIAKRVEAWRKTKKYRAEKIPKDIADNIAALAKFYKRYHIAEALKMSGSTINTILKTHQSIKNCKNIKKLYSAEEKQKLCQEWQQSGLSMEQFCKLKNISKTALYQWRKAQYITPASPNENWIPLIPQPCNETKVPASVAMELCLPNQWQARIILPRLEMIKFVQELAHATTVIR